MIQEVGRCARQMGEGREGLKHKGNQQQRSGEKEKEDYTIPRVEWERGVAIPESNVLVSPRFV